MMTTLSTASMWALARIGNAEFFENRLREKAAESRLRLLGGASGDRALSRSR
jgi:hypothetical protein